MVTQHFEPEPNFVTADIARTLSAKGSEVVVITTFPNYPFGKYYDSVKSIWPRKQKTDWGTIWRLPIYPDHSKSIFKRALYYSSFCVVSAILNLFLIIKFRPNTVVVYQTPFITAYGSLIYKFIGSKFVYICPDLWPESFTAVGIRLPRFIYSLLYSVSNIVNKFADQLIVSTDGIRKRYIRDGVDPNKIEFLPVWVSGLPDESMPSKPLSDKNIRVVYAGNLGEAQALRTLVEAANKLRNDKRFKFDIYGSGTEYQNLEQLILNLNLENIHLHGRVEPSTAFKALNQATFVLIHLKDTDFFNMTLPSKLASLLASGSIILCGAKGETANLIKKYNAGLVFEPENSDSLKRALEKAVRSSSNSLQGISNNGGKLYDEMFSPKTLVKNYSDLILSVS